MNSIDFLPPGYLARNRRRSMPWSTFAAAGVVGASVLAATIGQYVYGTLVDDRLADAVAQKALVDADLARLAELKSRRERLEAEVRRTYLTHRPTNLTAFLVEIGRSLPANCLLLEVVRVEESDSAAPPPFIPAPVAGTPEASTTGPSAVERDREKLRRQSAFADRETWIASGVSKDVASLHLFVETLERSSLGLSAKLTSFEADRRQSETIRFAVTVERERALHPSDSAAIPAGGSVAASASGGLQSSVVTDDRLVRSLEVAP